MTKIINVRYFTKERIKLINPDNIILYEKYLKSCILRNKECETTTYKSYAGNMRQFQVYLAENWNNVGLYDKDFFDNAIDIMEGFMGFCVETLKNHKKIINTKIAAISSFYIWSVKRRLIEYHPFDGKIDRMKGANDERVTKDYFLTDEQIEYITNELETNKKYDIQDKILFHLSLDSANRVGAISKITLSSLDITNDLFLDIREKGSKRVEIIFNKKCKEYIQEWLELRKNKDELKVDSLFITLYGNKYKAMSKGTLQDRAKKIGKIIGIDDFHMHCFRKTTINRIMNLTNDIQLAKELANHNNVSTTMIYVKPRSKVEIREKLNNIRQNGLTS